MRRPVLSRERRWVYVEPETAVLYQLWLPFDAYHWAVDEIPIPDWVP